MTENTVDRYVRCCVLSALGPLHMSPAGKRAGSVTGTNFVVCSYGKFRSGRPG